MTANDDDRFITPEDLDPAAPTKVTCPICEGHGMLPPEDFAKWKIVLRREQQRGRK